MAILALCVGTVNHFRPNRCTSVGMHKNGGAVLVNLYNNLAALCKERGLTPSGLCVKCGISKNVVARLKKNPSANLSYATASRFAQYLGVDVEEIQHGIKVRPTGNSELDRYLEMLRERPGLRALLKVHEGSTDEEIEANVRFIEQMRKK